MRDYYIQILEKRLKSEEFEKLKNIKSLKILKFIAESILLCNPDDVFVCSDTPDEIAHIKNMAIVSREESAALLTPGHTFHFDGYYDQGRDRELTRFLVPKGDKLSSSLNQMDRDEGLNEIKGLLKDSMKGKTMIIRFLVLGPANSVFTIPCIECTDSWYVAHSVDLLYRHGYEEIIKIDDNSDIFFTLHSAGELDENMTSKNYDKKRIYIDYTENTVYSVNTQYAGNSVGFKKLALRLAIRKAHREGWLAEHFMIIGVYGPNGRKTYIAGAFPSACGKTSTAMLEGERILSDDLAYVRNINGVCKAVNVECGIFGIIQGVNPVDDPLIYKTITSPNEIIFSNVLVKDGKVWWLDMGCELPKEGINYSGKWYKGKKDEKGEEILPSHKNARYTISLKVLPNCDEELENPEGVELGAIIFGGRDYRGYVPVQQGYDWVHGIIAYGVALETETTFAIVGEEGKYEINIMSIQDFVSITLGKYIENYIEFGRGLKKVPFVFGVNYFLRDLKTGDFLNSRKDKHVWIKWIELRVHNDVKAIETPTGMIPFYKDLRELFNNVLKKDYSEDDYIKQFTIRVPENIAKIERVIKFLKSQEEMPDKVFEVLEEQKKRLEKAREKFGDYISPLEFIK